MTTPESTGAWGEGTWGAGSWGGGLGTGFQFVDAIAIRENVIRVEFSGLIYFSGLLDPPDASLAANWTVTANGASVGMNGETARDVSVVLVTVSGEEDGVAPGDSGRFLNLTLDRPMTPWPAEYDIAWTNIFSHDLTETSEGTASTVATYRQLEIPQVEAPTLSQDLANPQTLSQAQGSLPNPQGKYALGSFGTTDGGDYANDSGSTNLKKRILRRLFTKKGAFLHLPGYGVGVTDYVKKLGTAANISALRSDAENQIGQEPDVDQVRVTVLINAATPNLIRLRVAVRPKVGRPLAFDLAYDSQAAA
jgi:hypothetical protein